LLGPGVTLVSSGAALARQVEHALSTRGLATPEHPEHPEDRDREHREGEYRFLCTGDVEAFGELGTRFLQMPLGEIEQIRLAPVEAMV
jgi:glutamate racemase